MSGLACNMSSVDRVARGLFAFGVLYLALFTDHLADFLLLALGGSAFALINIFAAVTGHCPMYRFTGTDTRTSRG